MTTLTNDWPSAEELERWAKMPLAQLQELERREYGIVLSVRRSVRDVPSKAQRAKRPKQAEARQEAE